MNWLTVREVSVQLDISDPTLRRYLRDHSDFVKMKKESNVLTIAEESLPILDEIRKCYVEKGWRKQRVHEHLREKHPLSIVIGEDDVGDDITVQSAMEGVQQMSSAIKELMEENQKMRKEVQRLREELEMQAQEKDSQQRLLEDIHRLLPSRNEKKRKGFLSKWFGKG